MGRMTGTKVITIQITIEVYALYLDECLGKKMVVAPCDLNLETVLIMDL